ncbi:MAG: hypothetical protein WA858_25250 [Xanthobacteraceae bacterium]|jgi:hypothetical protein
MFGLFRRILEAVTPQQQKRQEAAKTTNDQGIRDAARRIEKIKAICDLGKMHARAMRDSSLEPDLLASEQRNYEMYKHDAILSAGRLTDKTLRDSSLRLVINLCVYGGDDSEAKHLLSSVEGDSIKREILEEHPRLALHALITRRPPERR